MGVINYGFDKEKIRELAKEIEIKKTAVSCQFTLKLNKALEFPEFLTSDDVELMSADLKRRFFGDGKISVQLKVSIEEIIALVNSMRQLLKRKALIL